MATPQIVNIADKIAKFRAVLNDAKIRGRTGFLNLAGGDPKAGASQRIMEAFQKYGMSVDDIRDFQGWFQQIRQNEQGYDFAEDWNYDAVDEAIYNAIDKPQGQNILDTAKREGKQFKEEAQARQLSAEEKAEQIYRDTLGGFDKYIGKMEEHSDKYSDQIGDFDSVIASMGNLAGDYAGIIDDVKGKYGGALGRYEDFIDSFQGREEDFTKYIQEVEKASQKLGVEADKAKAKLMEDYGISEDLVDQSIDQAREFASSPSLVEATMQQQLGDQLRNQVRSRLASRSRYGSTLEDPRRRAGADRMEMAQQNAANRIQEGLYKTKNLQDALKGGADSRANMASNKARETIAIEQMRNSLLPQILSGLGAREDVFTNKGTAIGNYGTLVGNYGRTMGNLYGQQGGLYGQQGNLISQQGGLLNSLSNVIGNQAQLYNTQAQWGQNYAQHGLGRNQRQIELGRMLDDDYMRKLQFAEGERQRLLEPYAQGRHLKRLHGQKQAAIGSAALGAGLGLASFGFGGAFMPGTMGKKIFNTAGSLAKPLIGYGADQGSAYLQNRAGLGYGQKTPGYYGSVDYGYGAFSPMAQRSRLASPQIKWGY